MLYHISFPHHPFIQHFVEHFEKLYPGDNKVLLITNATNEYNRCEVPKHLIAYKGSSKENIIDIINNDKDAGVCLYWLNEDLMDIIFSLDSEIRIYFRSYGSDLHPILYEKSNKLTKPETKKLLAPPPYKRLFKNILRPAYSILKENLKNTIKKRYILFFRRINVIETVTRHEYDMLKSKIPELTNTFIQTKGYIKNNGNHVFPDNNENQIMIGHSSFALSNHADIFKQLAKYKINNNVKFIVPLSSGNMQYREKLIRLGQTVLKNHFYPITEYLDKDKYYKILDSCESFISNSYIQQAGATIDHFLRNGGKVYLDENNPIFIEAKRDGYIIFSIQEDLTEDHLFDYHLTIEEKNINRKLYFEIGENKSVEKCYKQIRDNLIHRGQSISSYE